MELILIEKVYKLGNIGDIVNVKNGYARNFLLPQKLALRATEASKAEFEAKKDALIKQDENKIVVANEVSSKITDKHVTLIRTSSESGQLYGSVNTRDIATAINNTFGTSITKNNVDLTTPIKYLGIDSIKINLHPEVITSVKINVARSEEEAALQIKNVNKPTKKEDQVEDAINSANELVEEIENN